MNCLKPEKKLAVVYGLVEGLSIRSISRMTGVHKTTISSFLCRLGEGCEKLLDETMKGLNLRSIQADEIWCYVGKKQKTLTRQERIHRPDLGDQYVFVALDADTKLVPVFEVGKRDFHTTLKFMERLATKISNRPQIFTDAFIPYPDVIDRVFGTNVDYAMIIKKFASEMDKEHRYSPPKIVDVIQRVIFGNPNIDEISTSYVERQNLTIRMQMRRFTRLTNAFSKSLKHLRSAIALHFANYNFCRIHQSLRVTPAMAAGVSRNLWTLEDILQWESNY